VRGEITLRLLSLSDLSELGEGEMVIAPGALPPSFITEKAVEDLAAGLNPVWNSYFLFIDFDGVAVGSGGFRGDPIDGRVEIGYGVAPLHQGRGIGTQAADLLVSQAFQFLEVAEVFAESSVVNPASRRVLEKAGFQHIGQRDTESEDGLVDRWLRRR
jgi:ribosomal-protein-alanine N-acetyltransferase